MRQMTVQVFRSHAHRTHDDMLYGKQNASNSMHMHIAFQYKLLAVIHTNTVRLGSDKRFPYELIAFHFSFFLFCSSFISLQYFFYRLACTLHFSFCIDFVWPDFSSDFLFAVRSNAAHLVAPIKKQTPKFQRDLYLFLTGINIVY